MPKIIDNKYDPPSPKYDFEKKLKIRKSIKKHIRYWIFKRLKIESFSIKNILSPVKTDKMYPPANIFVPSIKFTPLTKINIQSAVKRSLKMKLFSKKNLKKLF